jgi:hypothetical protein
MKSGGKGPLRNWSEASYDPRTGRAAKSSEPARESYSADGVVKGWRVSAQISEATGRAERGAPNISGMNRSGSGDPGRQRYSRDGSSDDGGRRDDQHPTKREH